VVVHDLYVLGTNWRPCETDPELVVDADAVLAGPIPFERLETVSGRDPQIVQTPGDLELTELASRHRLERNESLDAPARAQCLCVRIPI
jgi:hypothetical protein